MSAIRLRIKDCAFKDTFYGATPPYLYDHPVNTTNLVLQPRLTRFRCCSDPGGYVLFGPRIHQSDQPMEIERSFPIKKATKRCVKIKWNKRFRPNGPTDQNDTLMRVRRGGGGGGGGRERAGDLHLVSRK